MKEDMTWGQFLNSNSSTIGVVAFFAVMASGFLLWSDSINPKTAPLTVQRIVMVVVAGQIVGVISAVSIFGYFAYSKFFAPAVGAVAGLIGLPVLRATTKIGVRVEERAPDIADKGIDVVADRAKGKDGL